MGNHSPIYFQIWPAKPMVSILAIFGAALFVFFAVTGDQPFFARLALWIFALVVLMIAMGASIKTKVEVDANGNFAVIKTMAGIPFSSLRLKAGEITRVELGRQMSAGSATTPKSGDAGGSKPSTPRFRIDIVHSRGKFLVEASAKELGGQARKLAQALKCPLEKTGRW